MLLHNHIIHGLLGVLVIKLATCYVWTIEEGRAASKSPHYKFAYFLSMSQQAASADTIPNSAVGIFPPKTEGTKT
jgi:hypothetical protein